MIGACLDFAHWTPIGFRGGANPMIEWADLHAYPFDASFFNRIVRRWRTESPIASCWTGLDALAELDDRPSLDPSVIIAHASRCGSTLLARELASLDGAILISEPTFLETLFDDRTEGAASYAKPEVLRQLLRALGRIRFGTERLFILKLYSAATRFLPLVRNAFPQTPIIWLQRRPQEIVESQLHDHQRWAEDGSDLATDPFGFILQKQMVVWLAASRHVGDDVLVLDYSELPASAWTRAAPFMGIVPTTDDIRRMADVARVNSHQPDVPYERHARRNLPGFAVEAITSALMPFYSTLDRRRLQTLNAALSPL